MEKQEKPNKFVRKFFIPVELVLLALAVVGISLHYSHTAGASLLLIIVLTALSVWYFFKAITRDEQLRLKARIIYFCCIIPVIALVFALMTWKAYSLVLVAGLAGMAIGWGIFLWSQQRDRDKKTARQASSYMMFFRLLIYTAACLYLLFATDSKII